MFPETRDGCAGQGDAGDSGGGVRRDSEFGVFREFGAAEAVRLTVGKE